MPQLMIDTNVESTANLRLLTLYLTQLVAAREAAGEPPPPEAPRPAALPGDALLTSVTASLPPVPLPPPPPPPIGVSGAPTAIAGVADAGAPVASTAVFTPEYDSAGIQWDARIHQKAKAKKKDGTWKIQKNINQALLQQVTSELAIRAAEMRAASSTVSVGMPVAGEGVAPGAVVLASAPPLPPPPPPPVPLSAPPPPPVPVVPTAPAPAPGGSVTPSGAISFRDLISKIVAATRGGKITQAEVSEIVTKAGAPGLQMLSGMPHLIPTVDTEIDVLLLTRG